jgi:hypothetical protein
MAQAAVESAVSGGALIGRPAEVPRMKRKTPSELRVMPMSPLVYVSSICLFVFSLQMLQCTKCYVEYVYQK